MSVLEITGPGEELVHPPPASSFEATPFAMSCYLDPARNRVAQEIEDDAREICHQLARLGATTREWVVEAPDRDKDEVEYRLRAWCDDDRPRNTALVWVGHGESRANGAWLWVGGRPQPEGRSSDLRVKASELADYLQEQGARRRQWSARPGHWSMVLVQACGASGVARRLNSQLTEASEIAAQGLLIVACGKELGSAYPGQLPAVLKAAIDSFTDNTTSISLRRLAEAIEDRLHGIGAVHAHGLGAVRDIPRAGRLPDPLAAPWNAYRELSRSLDLLDDAGLQALIRAGTGTRLGELALRFVGRTEELASIVRWLRTQPGGLLVVTGPEGVGKSALLGNVDVHSRPAVRSWLEGAGLLLPGPGPTPAAPVVDVSLALHGAGVQDLLSGLLSGLGLDLGPGPWRVDDVRDAVGDAVRDGQREGPFTVLVDGLDHAREQSELRETLRRLTTATPLRIVAAARRWDRPEPSPEQPLPERTLPPEQTLALGRDPRAIETYVRHRLLDVTDPARDEALRDRVAGLVAGGHATPERQFLYATIAVHEILADPSVLGDPPRLAQLLDGEDEALFRAALRRMTAQVPAIRPYLAALALAQGPGMPRVDGIWTAAARALATAAEDTALTEESLDRVLDVAAPYVLVDVEGGVAVYRLAHRALAAVLLPADERAAASARLAVARALVALAARSAPDLGDHLTRHLPVYASASDGAGWRALAAHLPVLDAVDPRVVAAEAVRCGDVAGLPLPVLGTVATAHLDGDGGERAALRALGELYVTGGLLPEPAVPAAGAPWFPLWSRTRPQLPAMTLDIGSAPIQALAAFRDSSDHEVVVTGDGAGRVRLWDLRTARATDPAWTSAGDAAVRSVAVAGLPDRRLVLASADGGRVVQMWELGTGRWLVRAECDGDVAAVHLLPDGHGRLVLIVVRYDGWLEFRPAQAATTAPVSVAPGASMRGPARTNVSACAAAAPTNGPGVVVVACTNGDLEVWSAGGLQVGRDCIEGGPVQHLAAHVRRDGGVLVAARTWDTVHVGQVGGAWQVHDLSGLTGAWPSSAGPVCFFSRGAGAMAAATVVNRYLLVTDDLPDSSTGAPSGASAGGTPGTGRAPSGGLSMHVGDLSVLTASDCGPDASVLVAAGADGTLRLLPPVPPATSVADAAGDAGDAEGGAARQGESLGAAVTALLVGARAGDPVLIRGAQDGRVVVCAAADAAAPWSVRAAGGPVQGLALAPWDAQVLLVAGPDGLDAWDLVTRGRVDVHLPPALPEILGFAALSVRVGGRRAVTLHRDDRLRCLDLDAGELVDEIRLDRPGLRTMVVAAATGEGAAGVAVAGSTGVQTWSPGGPLRSLEGGVQVTSLAPVTGGPVAGGLVWGRQDGVVAVRDAHGGPVVTPHRHARRVTAVACREDGGATLLASADESGLVVLSDASTGVPARRLRLGRPVTALALQDDHVAVGFPDGVLMLTVAPVDATADTGRSGVEEP